jgi:hypothetical protein
MACDREAPGVFTGLQEIRHSAHGSSADPRAFAGAGDLGGQDGSVPRPYQRCLLASELAHSVSIVTVLPGVTSGACLDHADALDPTADGDELRRSRDCVWSPEI